MKNWAIGAGGAAPALTLSIVSLGTTGADFSDTRQGDVTGTIGSTKVKGSGGTGAEGLGLNFTGLLPGTPHTVTAGYQNTGAGLQDVWVVFNNAEPCTR